jgi:histidinol-phosphate phosphatase family protein
MVNENLTPIVQILTPKSKKVKNLIILDRDGTINRDFGYTHKLSDLVVLTKNLEIIKKFVDENSIVLCVTNQSGIGRGYFTTYEASSFNSALSHEIKKYQIAVDTFFMCPHTPDSNCMCRKPRTLMVEMALSYSKVPLSRSIFIGDSKTDSETCHKLGMKFIQVPKNNL